jgi:hypothetical protein
MEPMILRREVLPPREAPSAPCAAAQAQKRFIVAIGSALVVVQILEKLL